MPNTIGAKKLASIHIVKKELNLSDDEYRGILFREAGVESAKDLDEAKFRRLMKYFVRSRYYKLNPSGLTLRQKLFIQYLAGQLGWDKQHLENFIRKYYHEYTIDKLSKQEASRAIESLKNVLQHYVRA